MSFFLSGVALPVSYLNVLPPSWTINDLQYNADLVAAYASEIIVYNVATRYTPVLTFRHSRSADLDRTNLFDLLVKGEGLGMMEWTEKNRAEARELCTCLEGECGDKNKYFCDGKIRP
jgi:hypothetical protein